MRHWSYPARMCRKPISCGKAPALCFSFNISCHYWTTVLPRSVLHESLARQCQLYLINKVCIYRFNDIVKGKVSSGVTRTSNLHIRCKTTISCCWRAALPAKPEERNSMWNFHEKPSSQIFSKCISSVTNLPSPKLEWHHGLMLSSWQHLV